MDPKIGSGRFQWNAGGWFGSQIGSTLWLLLLGILSAPKSFLLSIIIICCFLAPNIIGSVLWTRRDRIAPYPAIQCLIAIIGICSLIAFVSCDLMGHLGSGGENVSDSDNIYWILLIFPAVMVMLHFLNRAGDDQEGNAEKQ